MIIVIFFCSNLGHTRTNCAVFLVVGVQMSKKWTSAVALFFLCSKTQEDHLNLWCINEKLCFFVFFVFCIFVLEPGA